MLSKGLGNFVNVTALLEKVDTAKRVWDPSMTPVPFGSLQSFTATMLGSVPVSETGDELNRT
jgi:hypothetical protein